MVEMVGSMRVYQSWHEASAAWRQFSVTSTKGSLITLVRLPSLCLTATTALPRRQQLPATVRALLRSSPTCRLSPSVSSP